MAWRQQPSRLFRPLHSTRHNTTNTHRCRPRHRSHNAPAAAAAAASRHCACCPSTPAMGGCAAKPGASTPARPPADGSSAAAGDPLRHARWRRRGPVSRHPRHPTSRHAHLLLVPNPQPPNTHNQPKHPAPPTTPLTPRAPKPQTTIRRCPAPVARRPLARTSLPSRARGPEGPTCRGSIGTAGVGSVESEGEGNGRQACTRTGHWSAAALHAHWRTRDVLSSSW